MRIIKSNKMYTTRLVNEFYEFEMHRCMRRVYVEGVLEYRMYLPADFTNDYKKLIECDSLWVYNMDRMYVSANTNASRHFTFKYVGALISDESGVYLKMADGPHKQLLELEKHDSIFVESNPSAFHDPFTMVPWKFTITTLDKRFVDSALVVFKAGIPR